MFEPQQPGKNTMSSFPAAAVHGLTPRYDTKSGSSGLIIGWPCCALHSVL